MCLEWDCLDKAPTFGCSLNDDFSVVLLQNSAFSAAPYRDANE